MAARGHRVLFVGGDYGQGPYQEIDGVKVVRSYQVGRGNRILRYPGDSISILRAMRSAACDIYFQRCVFHQTGRTYAFARLLRKKFVFSAGHDTNAWPTSQLPQLHPLYASSYRIAVRNADLVLCQNESQRQGFKDNYARNALLIPNMIDLSVFPKKTVRSPDRPTVLWVGTLCERKQPLNYVDLARALPQVDFQMVAQPMTASVEAELQSGIKGISNLQYLGFVPQHKIYSLFSTASVFVNTSTTEGFPNTFLQAMAAGIPIVSLAVNPDGVVSRANAGFACNGDDTALADAVRRLTSSPFLCQKLGENGRSFVEKWHSVGVVCEKYEEMFQELMAK
ncbi:MAG: glycosyltransferase family 1 protein [Actinobacteria bacterium]|nr:MAG: glycosyltransferase family 1 protein [Actinomycetota bacterium]